MDQELPERPYTRSVTVNAINPNTITVCRTRLTVVMISFIFAFSIITFRLLDVALLSGRVTVSEGIIEEKPTKISRSEIVDRNGRLLAINLKTASLYANPQKMLDIGAAMQDLKTIFPELDYKKIRQRIEQPGKQFVWVKRHLTPKMQYQANALGIPGLYFIDEEKRVYTQNNIFSHVLGYVNVDGEGLSGIEKSYNDEINYYPDLTPNKEPFKVSLDVRVQSAVYNALGKKMEEHRALGASALVMDVKNSEVLAAVSLPDFDPHNPNAASDAAKFNRAFLGVYEMGSTFKTFTVAMGLESGKIQLKDYYDVTNPIQVANFTIRDYHPKKGKLTVPEIFINSSNIGMAKMAQDIGINMQRSFLQRLGLLESLDVNLYEKSMPLFPEKWGKVRNMTVSYGHGIAVTPVHLAKATAAIVNGGILYPASLVPTGGLQVGRRVISEENSHKIAQLMRLAVTDGTGSRADVDGYMVGGKTGSADKASAGSYRRNATIASFIGVFPTNAPKYLVFVMLDEPGSSMIYGGGTTGGVTAAPVAREVIRRIGPMLGVMPQDEKSYKTEQFVSNRKYKRHESTLSF